MCDEGDDPVNRREAARLLVAGGAAAAVVACEEAPPPPARRATRDVVRADELAVGLPVDFAYPEPRHAAFAVRLGGRAAGGVGPAGDIVAFQRACPHMGCRIERVDAERGTFGPCECHQSLFDLRRGGAQIYGRATQNLVQIRLELSDDGTLCAVGLEGCPYGDPPAFDTDG